MTHCYFPPNDVPPLPMDYFTSPLATQARDFEPRRIEQMVNKYAAGVGNRPTAEQLRNWMNEESDIPEEHWPAIVDTIKEMDGSDYLEFWLSCGASLRGMAHLCHQTKAFSDRFVHFLDQFSDIGDRRERWDGGYAGIGFFLRQPHTAGIPGPASPAGSALAQASRRGGPGAIAPLRRQTPPVARGRSPD